MVQVRFFATEEKEEKRGKTFSLITTFKTTQQYQKDRFVAPPGLLMECRLRRL
jgi:hypothetical protein